MIKVIFVDLKDGEVQTVDGDRELLKDGEFQRAIFKGDVNVKLLHFLNKIRKESEGGGKCRKQSKR